MVSVLTSNDPVSNPVTLMGAAGYKAAGEEELMHVTILKRGPDTFRLRKETRDATGKRRFTYETLKGVSREDAEMRRLELLRAAREGGATPPMRNSQDPKLADYMSLWIRQRQLRGEITEKTAEWYKVIVNYVNNSLGTVPLRKLRPAHFQQEYDRLLADLSPRTVRHVHARLTTALDDAVVAGLLDKSPLAGKQVRPPKAAETKHETLSELEIKHLIDFARTNAPSLAPLIRFALATGLRRGELCALRWSDVDCDKCMVTVQWGVVQIGSRVELARPKTKAGLRTIALPLKTCAELCRLRDEATSEWVFPTSMGERRSPGGLTQQVNLVLKDAGLGHFTLHDLRHAHASLLLRQRMPIKAVSQRLGHADIGVTLRTYAHVIPQDDMRLAEAMNRMLPDGEEDDEEPEE